ncbi:MAG: glycosyltransferase, partial [archaeon]
MKILFTAPGFHSNQYYASKTLYVHDVEVHYLLLRKNNCSDYKFIKTRTLKIKQSPKFIRYLLKILKIDTKPANSTYSINSFPSYSNLKKNIKEIKPNLTIIRGRTLYSLMANICCKSLKIKTIRYEQVVLENDKVYLAKGFKNLFKIIKKVQNIILPKILVTPIIKNFDMSFKEMKKRKRYFLPLPIEVNKNIKRTNSKKIRIIMVAKYEPRKNHILFLKAIIKLRKKYEFKIKFIGASGKYDYLSTIKDFVKKNNLEKIVTFKNDIKHKEVLKEYSKHDLFVLPAHSEEFGY